MILSLPPVLIPQQGSELDLLWPSWGAVELSPIALALAGDFRSSGLKTNIGNHCAGGQCNLLLSNPRPLHLPGSNTLPALLLLYLSGSQYHIAQKSFCYKIKNKHAAARLEICMLYPFKSVAGLYLLTNLKMILYTYFYFTVFYSTYLVG